MKLITLNIWGGRVGDRLPGFFKAHEDTDMWCFQEVFSGGRPPESSVVSVPGFEPDRNLYNTLKGYLPSHQSKFCQTRNDVYGIGAFVGSGFNILEYGEMLLAKGNWLETSDDAVRDHHRKLQWLEIEIDGKVFLLMNVHLTHRPVGKSDSEKRLRQSKIIVDLVNMFDCPKILVGDFNLLPDTESIRMIERSGMRNLVREYGVTSTRTSLYKKDLRFADYIFVSKEFVVKDFKVLPDEVSDHAPLMLDFEIK